jgi:hypothetical protein
MAVRLPSPASNSLGILRAGQAAWQSPQPLQRSSFTVRALRRIVTSKLPM